MSIQKQSDHTIAAAGIAAPEQALRESFEGCVIQCSKCDFQLCQREQDDIASIIASIGSIGLK